MMCGALDWGSAGIRSIKLIGDAAAPGPIAWATYAGRRYAEELDAPDIGDDLPFRREIAELLHERRRGTDVVARQEGGAHARRDCGRSRGRAGQAGIAMSEHLSHYGIAMWCSSERVSPSAGAAALGFARRERAGLARPFSRTGHSPARPRLSGQGGSRRLLRRLRQADRGARTLRASRSPRSPGSRDGAAFGWKPLPALSRPAPWSRRRVRSRRR